MSKHLEFYRAQDWRRETAEPKSSNSEPYRSSSRRDYARLLHTPAFRRLQRKTQLFPGEESDFFRTRITHSFEVAQIAKSIALRLNYLIREQGYTTTGIDTDLVETAALAHDIGHPPFGHTGEYALDECMKNYGGFEGNAQTLRILTRVEKKRTRSKTHHFEDFVEFQEEEDLRTGLNLSYRTLAAVLKYDRVIPQIRNTNDPLSKGYYASEASLVEKIKAAVIGPGYKKKPLSTVEMQIMDIADDIAYSTYDLEDAMKGGFTSPLELLSQVNSNEEVRQAVAEKLFRSKFDRDYLADHASPEDRNECEKIKDKMERSLIKLFERFFDQINDYVIDQIIDSKYISSGSIAAGWPLASHFSLIAQKFSNLVQSDGYNRVMFTSELVGKRINSIGIEVNEENPAISKVLISNDDRFDMDVLKHLTYELQIRAPRLRIIESRGRQIVQDLYQKFSEDSEGELLPSDWRARVRAVKKFKEHEALRVRLVCDYIAGMTDAYALDVYSRLTSTNTGTFFRPL